MIVNRILSGVDSSGLNKISPEFSSYNVKDKYIIELKIKYDNFKRLLEHNRKIKRGSNSSRLTIRQIEEIVGLSETEYYRIGKKLEKGNWKDIERKSKKPKNVRQSKIPKETIDLILEIRLENIAYGKDKIGAILYRDYNVKKEDISISTVGRILNRLKQENKIPKYSSSQTLKKRYRKFDNSYAKKWDYDKHCICNGDRTSIGKISIGELIQIDHMTVTKNNVVMKQFTAIDPITRIIVSEVYSNATSFTAMKFLREKVLEGFPFKVKSRWRQ
jgi:hypothetical protein